MNAVVDRPGPHGPVPGAAGEDRGPRALRIAVEGTLLLLILVVGALLRAEDLRHWQANAEVSFVAGEPILREGDGYFYLALARDLAQGAYGPIHERRNVPVRPRRPQPPPLLSVLAAGISQHTAVSLNWVAATMPIFLGPLLALPLFALGRAYGGPVMGLAAAWLAVIAPYYMHRSSLGWFDTDFLNITLIMGVAYAFLRFGTVESRRRYLFFAAAVVLSALLYWTWDHGRHVVFLSFALPFAVALAFYYRPGRTEVLVFLGILAVVAAFFSEWLYDLAARTLRTVAGNLEYFSKVQVSDEPVLGLSVTEQKRPSFSLIMLATTGHFLPFFFAAAGLLGFMWKHGRDTLFLITPYLIAGLAIAFSQRFLLFLVPMMALGSGFLLSEIWRIGTGRHRWFARAGVAALAAALTYFAVSPTLKTANLPVNMAGGRPAGMLELARTTPPDAVVWTWWDFGWPILYWADRATISDGGQHYGELLAYNGLPFATGDERLAANFMRFFVVRGARGLNEFYDALGGGRPRGYLVAKEVLAAGPEGAYAALSAAGLEPGADQPRDWVEFFFPADVPPVYLYLPQHLAHVSAWISWYGTWDFTDREGRRTLFELTPRLTRSGKRYLAPGWDIDVERGTVFFKKSTSAIPLIRADTVKGREVETRTFPRETGYVLTVFPGERRAVLMDPQMAKSVFARLFTRPAGDLERFRLVKRDGLEYQIWEVTGEPRAE